MIKLRHLIINLKSKVAVRVGLLMLLGFLVVWLISYFIEKNLSNTQFTYGVSFSPYYAQSLGLDWKTVYLQTLDDLGVRRLRLPTYWATIEEQPGIFNFTETDFLLEEANKREAKVLLVVGIKQPRWPECQIPKWAYELTPQERKLRNLQVVRQVINRYKNRPEIWGWQVENEPLFQFGLHCDPPDENYLKTEVDLVRSLDPSRPIIITETGEWQSWIAPMKFSDVLGLSLYRKVNNKFLGNYTYPFWPSFYNLKANLIKKILAPNNQKTIIAELQTEPWSPKPLNETPIEKKLQFFSLEDFKDNIKFAQKTGFSEIYLWGVEWWYFMKDKGYPQYWQYAQQLF